MKNVMNHKTLRPNRRRRFASLSLTLVAASVVTANGDDRGKPVRIAPQRLPAVTSKLQTKKTVKPRFQEVGIRVPSVDRPAVRSAPERWLRSTTSTAAAERANELIVKGSQEYGVRAWLSAETTAWESLRAAAESVDLVARESNGLRTSLQSQGAVHALKQAKDAIVEARDFGTYGADDSEAVARIARSHQTQLLSQSAAGVTPTDAADRYLDHARVLLAQLAGHSNEAARAMDLMAAIYLQRNDPTTLPSGTSLALRRAALQGQPQNPSLAARLGFQLSDLGLLDEARWTLEHSMSLQPDPSTGHSLVSVLHRSGDVEAANTLIAKLQQGAPASAATTRIPVPEIEQLSPEQFAAVSKPVMTGTKPVTAVPVSAKLNVTTESTITPPVESDIVEISTDSSEKQPSALRRMLNRFKQIW